MAAVENPQKRDTGLRLAICLYGNDASKAGDFPVA